MASAGRYRGPRRFRKWSVRAWDDPRFLALGRLEPCPAALYMYLTLGNHRCALPSLVPKGRAAMMEELRWTADEWQAAWQPVEQAGMAHADWDARLVWVPNTLKHNHPESPSVVTAWLRSWGEAPECEIQQMARQEVADYLAAECGPIWQAAWQAAGQSAGQAGGHHQQEPQQEPEPEPQQEPEPIAADSDRVRSNGAELLLPDSEPDDAALLRCGVWLRQAVPTFDMNGNEILPYLRRRLARLGRAKFRADMERVVVKAKTADNPGAYLRRSLEDRHARKP